MNSPKSPNSKLALFALAIGALTAARKLQSALTPAPASEPSPTPNRDVRLSLFNEPHSNWRHGPGPFGRGDCLSERQDNGVTLILAPPGVPLAPPELVTDLMCWRFARWASGSLLGAPDNLTFPEALRIAPSQRDWIMARQREHEKRNTEAGAIPADGQDGRLGSLMSQTERTGAAPQDEARGTSALYAVLATPPAHGTPSCAHRFSQFIGSCADDAPLKTIAREANRSSAFDDFLDQVAHLAAREGSKPVREAIIGLLYARARSRTWRLTHVLDRLSREHGFVRQLTQSIDQASSPQALERAFLDLASQCPNLTEEVIGILYDRAHSLRWRSLSWLRLLGASPHLSGTRTFLREHVPPALRLDNRPGDASERENASLQRGSHMLVHR